MNYYFGFAVSGFSHTRATSKRKQATDETKMTACQYKSLYNSMKQETFNCPGSSVGTSETLITPILGVITPKQFTPI